MPIIIVLFVFFSAIPVFFLSLEILGAWVYQRRNLGEVGSNYHEQISYVVLIPAHNEEDGIGSTLVSLLDHVQSSSQILVVADNCTDKTAQIAGQYGAIVIERYHDILRGKGYALDYGIQHLKATSCPDVLVILDADCSIGQGRLNTLVQLAKGSGRPVQGKYYLNTSTKTEISLRIASFAMLFKNYIRPLGLKLWGHPCLLYGTGMALPWQTVEKVQFFTGNIVEDMQLGIDCVQLGYPPLFCEKVTIESSFPTGNPAVKTQRTRWEHGHLKTLFSQVPKLFFKALKEKNMILFIYAFEIGVPPLSLLILLQLASGVITVSFGIISGSWFIIGLAFLPLTLLGIIVFSGWAKFDRNILSSRDMAMIPLYILKKIPLYLKFIYKPENQWVRTSRKDK